MVRFRVVVRFCHVLCWLLCWGMGFVVGFFCYGVCGFCGFLLWICSSCFFSLLLLLRV